MVRKKQSFPFDGPSTSNSIPSTSQSASENSQQHLTTDTNIAEKRNDCSRKRKNANECVINLDKTDDDFETLVVNETEELDYTARTQNRNYKAKQRANMSENEIVFEHEINRERIASQRMNMSEHEIEKVREQDRIRKAERKLEMTDPEIESERERDRKRKAERRMAMTDPEIEFERERNKIRMEHTRATMLESNKQSIRDTSRISMDNIRKHRKENDGILYLCAAERDNIDFYELGPFECECIKCNAVHFNEEKPSYYKGNENEFYLCCNFGKFSKISENIEDYPDDLRCLFDMTEKSNRNFLINIRKYNNSFACASFACCRFNFPTPGIPCFKISGQVYHMFNQTAQPNDNEQPSNGQLYFIESTDAQTIRTQKTDDLDPIILNKIEIALRTHYPFAQAYEMMKDVIADQENSNNTENYDVKMLLSLREGFDPNRYNVQRCNEVAAIVVCNANDEIPPANIVVVQKGTKDLRNMFPLDPCIEPLIYPLLYPKGTRGWNVNLKDINNKRISLCDYIKYKLFYRKKLFWPHHHSGKLFQQWIVDQCARVEWNRLNYIRNHQKEIRASNYKGLNDYLMNRAEQEGAIIGKQIILPSTFTGGPRNKDQNYIDSIAIVGETGKPDLFVTYTCNPQDPDIKKCLLDEQTVDQRPDIVARVFKLKAEKLISEIVKDELFGKVIAYCWVVEFQKRGLPHLHFLITLDPKNKFKNKDEIDKIISAELPNKDNEPELRKLVKNFMLHGPCGELWKNAPCMRNGKCRFKFPKKFREDTELGEDGYALYKRPNNGEYEYVKGIRLTNQNVAPYNAYLLQRFRSHINVEVCSEINAIKYIYKYIYKGFDAATVECVQNGPNGEQILLKYDEINQYLEARYLSPIESCYRLFKYDLQGKSHAVERLDLHMEGEQMIYFDQNSSNDLIRESMQKESKLMAYFKFFSENPDAPKYKYVDMPKWCTFDEKLRKWKWPRKGHHKVIGRMFTINPKNTELFYLRYLLLHVHGKSFKELRTVNNIEYKTFAQACLAHGLTKDDEEWDKCLLEASQFKFPKALRTLFVNILINCAPKYPGLLWEKHKNALSQDLKRTHSDEIAYEKTLLLIKQSLEKQEKQLNDFEELPEPSANIGRISEHDVFDPKTESILANRLFAKMNQEQQEIFVDIKINLESTAINKQRIYYIDGPGGTGKSFVQTALYHLARSYGKKVCNVAFSGIAATLLKDGRTAHNRFKLPLDLNCNSTSAIEVESKDAKELIDIDIYIWDEAPMAPRFAFEIVDKKLRELCKSDGPFGGKFLIASGDFRQTSPIKSKATRSELIDLSLKKSYLWQYFKVAKLRKNMRTNCDNSDGFSVDLLKIGNGEDEYSDFIKIPQQCDIGDNELVDEIFGELIKKHDFNKLCSRCILAPYNREVDMYNEQILNKFPGEYLTFHSIDDSEGKNGICIQPEILHQLNCSSLPAHELKLKVNCIAMLLRNINVDEGMCNGTRIQILDINKNVLRGMILTGDRNGEIIFVPRITLIEDKKFPYALRRHQYPVRLAFCMTINKGQGQTFEQIGLDFQREAFAHGQPYTAISRTRAWERIKIKLSNNNKERKLKNIVWKELL